MRDHGKPNRLLLNDGSLRFRDATDASGAATAQNTFYSTFIDLDSDGWPELVVAQNTGQVELLRNRAGRFEPVPLDTGYGFWMGIAVGISKVTTPIFMGIIFFVVIAPIGLFMRLVRRNPVKHKPRNGSYWTDHAAEDERGTMTNQF